MGLIFDFNRGAIFLKFRKRISVASDRRDSRNVKILIASPNQGILGYQSDDRAGKQRSRYGDLIFLIKVEQSHHFPLFFRIPTAF
jgi:hypothetical protein